MIAAGNEYMHCPFCQHLLEVSPEDPDSSFSEMLGHVRWQHPGEDQAPASLWPKIEVK
jgi:hypothetical protein